MPFNPSYDVTVSLDFGRRPTALISQEINHRVQIQREFRMYGVGAAVFAPELKKFLTQNYPGARIRFYRRPEGTGPWASGRAHRLRHLQITRHDRGALPGEGQ